MRVAVVTGAARGIGAAAALRLAASGFRLVLVDACADDPAVGYPLATRGDLDSVVESCGGAGAAIGVVADVRDGRALKEACGEAAGAFGGLDAAVAAAGVIAGGMVSWETPEASFEAVVGVDLLGVHHLAAAAVPLMLGRPAPRSGRFVAVASAAAVVGLPRLGAYAAAKHGVVGYVRSLAADLGGTGITANVVAPGSTLTPMLEESARLYGLDDPGELAEHHLDRRILEPDEVAAAVVFLCQPQSSGLTGAVVPVDAGMTAR
ncbi:MAG: mycofactocin-coupled SDR family oxidoreductase [Acidimicrobiales bacterium]